MKMNRYQRQILLPDFGLIGQMKLIRSRVTVIGAGGLGSPLLTALCRAGVGNIVLIDGDKIQEENLHRQTLFIQDDVGKMKATVAAMRLKEMNPDVQIRGIEGRLIPENAHLWLFDTDLVVDASDNFGTRYLINDTCVNLGIPLVYGAVFRHEIQVAIFNVADENGVRCNYRDLCPERPGAREVQACDETGIMGTLTGIAGLLMASEVIKILSGTGQPLINRVLVFNGSNLNQVILKLKPQTRKQYINLSDYDQGGSIDSAGCITQKTE